jgi:apolipoprotein N-acyltransferase
MIQKRAIRYFLSILSGLLLVVCFPFTGSITPLIFVALIPLLFVEDSISVQKRSSANVFLHSYITFFIYNLGTTFWIWNSTEVGGVLAFVFNSLLMTLAFQCYHFAKKHIGRKEGYISLLIIWTAFEYAHFNWELSWPWLAFGDAFSIRTNWIQWYEYVGVLGGTLWVLVVNLLLFLGLKKQFTPDSNPKLKRNFFVIASVILVFPIAYSYWMLQTPYLKGKTLEVVLVQPNIDPYNEKFSPNSTVEAQLNKFFDLAEKKVTKKTDLLIGPETAISQGFLEPDLKYFKFYQLMQERLSHYSKTDLLIGASTALAFKKKVSRATLPLGNGNGFYESYNTSLFVPKSGKHSFIHKSKLVLGVEKLPFSNYFPFLEELAISNGGTSGTLGIEAYPKNFKTKNSIIAPIVCYESIYGDFVSQQVRTGAELLCIITNDGWWKDTPGYKQHFSFARLRAIENRRWVVRSANTGTSGVINEKGEVLQTTDWWVPAVIKAEVQLSKKQTIYATYGDFIGRSFAFVAVLILIFALKNKIRPLKGK